MQHNYLAEATQAAQQLGVDFSRQEFSVNDLARGLEVEYEHGTENPKTNVTNDDLLMTANIALAHLNEFPDYYTRLHIAEKPQLINVGQVVSILVVASIALLILHFFQDHLGYHIIDQFQKNQLTMLVIFSWTIVGIYIYKK